jgi:TolB-like protein
MDTKPMGLSFKKMGKNSFSTDHGHETRTRCSPYRGHGSGTWTRLVAILLLFLATQVWAQGPVRVAILPFQIHSAEDLSYLKEGIYDVISSRLAASGAIDAIGKSSIERVLAEMHPPSLTEEVAREAGIRLKADYVVLGSITKIAEFISLDALLIDTAGNKPPSGAFAQTKGLDQLMGKVDEFARDIRGKILGEPAVVAKEGQAKTKTPYIVRPKKSPITHTQEGVGFQKSEKFPFEIRGLDIADVDGDGRNEIIFMDRDTLWVYQYVEGKLRPFRTLKGAANQQFLGLDAADVNGNGTAEIFVTSIEGENLTSFILEYEENGFKRVSGNNGWYFRVLDLPGKGPTLLGQKMGLKESFSGSVYQFRWKKNTFSKGKKLKLPKGTWLLGLAIADVTGDGKDEIIRFDGSDHLRLLSMNGKDLLYKTPASYGGSNNFFDRESVPEGPPRDRIATRVYLPGRIVLLDLDGDGRVEVIVNKNHFATGRFLERVRFFDRGEVYNLVWDGLMLAENWRTKEIPGYIADYQVKDFDNDGQRELVVAMVSQFQAMQRPDSYILFFDLY